MIFPSAFEIIRSEQSILLGTCASYSFLHFNYLIYFWLSGSLLLCGLFSSCGEWELLSSCSTWASYCGAFLVAEHGF